MPPMTMRARRPKHLGWSLVIGLLCFLGVLEAGARWMDPRMPTWVGRDHQAVVMTGHPTRLWGVGAGTRDNAGTKAHISELGIREPVPETPRPPARARLLLLGDSTFFGYGVSDGDTLSSQIERLFEGQIDTVNAGIPGYSILQSQMLMDDVGWDTEPTLLLIGSFWSDTRFAPYSDEALLKSRAAAQGALQRHSALARLVEGKLRLGGVVSWTRFDAMPEPTMRRVGVVDYARAIDSLIRQAAARGIGAALITPPEAIVITAEVEPPHHWEPYLEAQVKLARHHQIPLIRTTVPFKTIFDDSVMQSSKPEDEARSEARALLFMDDLHPSIMGHELMAQSAFEGLSEAGWPQTSLVSSAGTLDLTQFKDGRAAGDTADRRSPMSNLFPHGAVPPPQGPAPERTVTAASEDEAWVVSGQTSAGSCRVKIQSSSGQTLASASLLKPGPYRFTVPAGVAEVRVILKGDYCAATGRAVRAEGGQVQISAGSR